VRKREDESQLSGAAQRDAQTVSAGIRSGVRRREDQPRLSGAVQRGGQTRGTREPSSGPARGRGSKARASLGCPALRIDALRKCLLGVAPQNTGARQPNSRDSSGGPCKSRDSVSQVCARGVPGSHGPSEERITRIGCPLVNETSEIPAWSDSRSSWGQRGQRAPGASRRSLRLSSEPDDRLEFPALRKRPLRRRPPRALRPRLPPARPRSRRGRSRVRAKARRCPRRASAPGGPAPARPSGSGSRPA
jgi:hypothetical protein